MRILPSIILYAFTSCLTIVIMLMVVTSFGILVNFLFPLVSELYCLVVLCSLYSKTRELADGVGGKSNKKDEKPLQPV
jgi:hypothetical protein